MFVMCGARRCVALFGCDWELQQPLCHFFGSNLFFLNGQHDFRLSLSTLSWKDIKFDTYALDTLSSNGFHVEVRLRLAPSSRITFPSTAIVFVCPPGVSLHARSNLSILHHRLSVTPAKGSLRGQRECAHSSQLVGSITLLQTSRNIVRPTICPQIVSTLISRSAVGGPNERSSCRILMLVQGRC